MSPAEPDFDPSAAHRWFAIEWNNAAWDALESALESGLDESSDLDTTNALHVAHGSLAHWREVGNELNHIRALCVVANAEALFGASASAIRFADHALALANGEQGEVEGLADWDEAFLLDARMRAAVAALQEEQSRTQPDPQRVASLQEEVAGYEQRAKACGEAISDEGDRKFFLEWFAKR